MQLFGRTSGYYLFWTGFVYFWLGLYLALTHSEVTHIATIGWLFVVSIPLWCPPVARYFNMEPLMFDMFGKKDSSSKDNVYNLPTPKVVPPVPEVTPPVKEKDPVTFYRLGLTDNNRVSFQMGYTEITMSHRGCQQMIDQLAFFQSQLDDYNNGGDDDPDGGEPVPVPEKKAA